MKDKREHGSEIPSRKGRSSTHAIVMLYNKDTRTYKNLHVAL
jgi:hypothetical protein